MFDYLLTPDASIKLFNFQTSWIKRMESIDGGECMTTDMLPDGKYVEYSCYSYTCTNAVPVNSNTKFSWGVFH